jgi:hypothetical protein
VSLTQVPAGPKMTIEQRVRSRNIRHLTHFTRAENLPGILRYGILPRSEFEHLGSCPIVNDGSRLDYCLNATSVSIGFPNYKMFYRLRKENPETTWVVLVLDPSVLWRIDCAYCVENAAKSSVSSIPLAARKGPEAFKSAGRGSCFWED